MDQSIGAPAYKWITQHVFISSTFKDFHAEREYLIKYVFPELREWCLQWRIHLVDIDLRWGITEEDARSGKVLELCLDSIDTAYPFFIGLLGGRYGKVFSEADWASTSGRTIEKLRTRSQEEYWKGRSITHLEIIYGALQPDRKKKPPHSFFYFRKGDSLPAEQPFYSGEEESYIEALKEEIVSKFGENTDEPGVFPEGKNIFYYTPEFAPGQENSEDGQIKGRIKEPSLYDFGQQILTGLKSALKAEFAERMEFILQKQAIGPQELELHQQEAFAAQRTLNFIERKDLLDPLWKYCTGDQDQVMLVHGAPGSGKSTILSRLYELLAAEYQEDEDTLLIPHFVGASPASTSLPPMLYRICDIIQTTFKIERQIPVQLEELIKAFLELINKVDRRIILIIDAINQLDALEDQWDFTWIPSELKPKIKIIISTSEGSALAMLRSKTQLLLHVEELTPEEQSEIIDTLPRVFAKKLDEAQQQMLKEHRGAKNPLWLKVAIERLRLFGSFEKLNQRIADLDDNIEGLFIQLIEELEEKYKHENSVVASFFCLLACSRFGLTEKELEELLEEDTNKIHKLLIQMLRPFLQYREATLGFHHQSLARAVSQKYQLASEGAVWQERLARYFSAQPLFFEPDTNTHPNLRKVLELPWLMARSGRMWPELEELLCDLWFLDAKIQCNLPYDLLNDYQIALRSMPGNHRLTEAEKSRLEAIQVYVDGLVACAGGQRLEAPVLPSYDFSRPVGDDVSLQGGGKGFSRIKMYEQFVEANLLALRLGASFPHHVFQVAFNSAKDGPVVEQATRIFREAKGTIRGAYLLNRKAFKENFSAQNLLKRSITGFPGIGPLKITADGSRAILSILTRSSNLVFVSSLEVWDLTLGRRLSKFSVYKDLVTFLDITPDGTKAVTAAMGFEPVKVWDLETSTHLGQLQLKPDWSVSGVSITADGRMIYATTLDGDLIAWNWAKNDHKNTTLGTRIVQFSADSIGKKGIALAPEGNLLTLDLLRMQVNGQLTAKKMEPDQVEKDELPSEDAPGLRALSDHINRLKEQMDLFSSMQMVGTLSITPDGRYAAFNCEEDRIWVFEMASLNVVFNLKIDGTNRRQRKLKLTADGRYLIVVDDGFNVYDVWSGRRERGIRHRLAEANLFDCTPDGIFLLSDFRYAVLNWWNIQAGQVLSRKRYQDFNSVAFGPDGEFVCATYFNEKGSAGRALSPKELHLLLLNGHGHVMQEAVLVTERNMNISKPPIFHFMNSCELLLLIGEKIISLPLDVPKTLTIEAGNVDRWVVNATKDKVLYSTKKKKLFYWDVNEDAFSMIRELGPAAPPTQQKIPEHPVVALSADGRIMASGHTDGYIAIWGLPSGKLKKEFRAHEGQVTAIGLSGWGLTIVSGDEKGEIRTWNRDGVLAGKVQAHQARITTLTCGGSDNIFVSSALEGVIKLWDQSKLTLRGTLDLGQVRIRQIDFSEAAGILVYSTDKGRIGVYNLVEQLHSILEEGVPEKLNNPLLGTLGLFDPQMTYGLSYGGLIPVAISKSGRTIVTGENGLRVKRWKNLGGRWSPSLLATGAHLDALCLLDDDEVILATSGHLELFGLSFPGIRQRFYHSSPIPDRSFRQIAASSDGKMFLTANGNQTIWIWDRVTKAHQELKKPLHQPEKADFKPVYFFTKGSKQSVVRTTDGSIDLIDLSTREKQTNSLQEHALGLEFLGTTPQQEKIIATTPENTVKVWNSPSGVLLATLSGHQAKINQWAIPAEDRLLTRDSDGVIKIWDLDGSACLASTKGYLRGQRFANDHYFVTTDLNHQQLFFWETSTAQCVQTLTVSAVRAFIDLFRGKSVIVAGGNTLDLYEIVSIGETGANLPVGLLTDAPSEAEPPPPVEISLKDYPVEEHAGVLAPEFTEKTKAEQKARIEQDSSRTKTNSPTSDEAIQAFQEMLNYLRTGRIPDKSQQGSSAKKPVFESHEATFGASENLLSREQARPDGLAINIGHHTPIHDVQFSPDGKILASTGGDHTIKLWDIATGRLVRNIKGRSSIVHAIDFSPDGKYLISGNSDNTLVLWEIETAKALKVYSSHTGAVLDVKFVHNGEYFISSSWDTTVKIWDVERSGPLYTFFGHKEPVFSIAYDPYQRIIASGSRDGAIHIWKLEDGKHLHSIDSGRGNVSCLAFSPDGNLLIAGIKDKIKLWQVRTWDEIYTIKQNDLNISNPLIPLKEDNIYSVSFSPDGAYFVIGSWGKHITLWDTESGQEVRTVEKRRGATLVYALAFSQNGQFIASGSNRSVLLWNSRSFDLVHEFGERMYSVNTCSVSPDGRYLVSGHGDRRDGGQAFMWEMESGRMLHAIRKIDKRYSFSSVPVASVCFSPNGKTFATNADSKGGVILYDLSGNPINKFEWPYVEVNCIDFSKDGSLLCAGSERKDDIVIWSVAEGSKIKMLQGHKRGVANVQFSPDGSKIISKGRYDNEIILWDFASGERIWTLKDLIISNFVQFSPDGNTILTCGEGLDFNKIKLRRISDGSVLKTFSGHTKEINCAIFCSDNYIVSGGGSDKKIIVWNVLTGAAISSIDTHTDQLTSLCNIANTPYFVSASKDGAMKVWEIGKEKEIMTLYSFVNNDASIALTPDGKYCANENGLKCLHYIKGMEVVELPAHDPNFLTKLLHLKNVK